MADADEIAALVHSYAERLDTGDLDGVADLFTHATWRAALTGQVLRGRDEVRAVYDRVALYDGTPRTKHVITNLGVDVDPGGETATAHCYFTVLQGIETGRPIEVILAGRYDDRFARIDGRWVFSDRQITADHLGDQRRHYR